MPMGVVKKTDPTSDESVGWVMSGDAFFNTIASRVEDPSTIPNFSHREIRNISLRFNIAGTELSTYMSVTEPSSSINQEKPNYTNISNGIGIFSSRAVVLWESSIDPETEFRINLNNPTIRYLNSLGLGFCFGTSGVGSPEFPCQQKVS